MMIRELQSQFYTHFAEAIKIQNMNFFFKFANKWEFEMRFMKRDHKSAKLI